MIVTFSSKEANKIYNLRTFIFAKVAQTFTDLQVLRSDCGVRVLKSNSVESGQRPRGRRSSAGRVKNFLHVVQAGSGIHPTYYPMVSGGSSPGGKAAGV
jgi:hypothetical protein